MIGKTVRDGLIIAVVLQILVNVASTPAFVGQSTEMLYPHVCEQRQKLVHACYWSTVGRLRGGSSFNSPWSPTFSNAKTSQEDLKKNIQLVLEKNPSGVMGRDLRRLYKEVTGKDLPLQDFSVQRPIELVEKELSDTVYYTRESDGDVKYFLRKKMPEVGHRPLWQLTSHGDDHCPTVVPGDVSFEELKLQVFRRSPRCRARGTLHRIFSRSRKCDRSREARASSAEMPVIVVFGSAHFDVPATAPRIVHRRGPHPSHPSPATTTTPRLFSHRPRGLPVCPYSALPPASSRPPAGVLGCCVGAELGAGAGSREAAQRRQQAAL